MTPGELEQRVAILLDALGEEMAAEVLGRLSPQGETRMRQRMQDLAESPPDDEEIAEVIDEFDRVLKFAVDTIDDELRQDVAAGVPAADAEAAVFAEPAQPAGPALAATEDSFDPSEDAVSDLQRLEPYQIAGGLLGEAPRTVAIVLDCLEPEKASETLTFFPDATKGEVFSQLKLVKRTPPALLTRIVRSTIERGLHVSRDIFDSDDTSKEKKLADMLRVMDKKQRTAILEQLEQEDAALVEQIRGLLYEFEDLLKIEDRSVQKLLGEVETKTLCTALSDSDEAIIDKVTSNLSKRARESLLEEMNLMGTVREEEQEAARSEVTGAMQRLDQAGDLVML